LKAPPSIDVIFILDGWFFVAQSRRQNQRRAAPRPEKQAVGGFSRSAASWIEGFVEDVLAEPRQCSEIGQLSALAARVKDLREAAVKLQGLPPAPVAGVAPFLYDYQAALQTGGSRRQAKVSRCPDGG
jgi:hypothetical protein